MIVETCKGYRDAFANVAGWSSKWHSSAISNPTPAGRKAVQAQLAANNQEAVIQGKGMYNGRIICRMRQANTGTAYAFGLAVRVGGTATAKEAVVFRLQSVNLNMMRLSASGTITSNITNANRQNVPGTWYWFDLLMFQNRYLFQVWEDGTPRPAWWIIAATFANLSGTQFGIYTANANAIIQCDKLITDTL